MLNGSISLKQTISSNYFCNTKQYNHKVSPELAKILGHLPAKESTNKQIFLLIESMENKPELKEV